MHKSILLEQNYRSRQNILNAAMGVIDRARNRKHKKLFTERGEGEKIFFYEAPDDYCRSRFCCGWIAQLVASRQFEPGDCAVMYRTNAMSRLVEEAFLQARLPLSACWRAAVLWTARSQGHHCISAPDP